MQSTFLQANHMVRLFFILFSEFRLSKNEIFWKLSEKLKIGLAKIQ